MLILEETIQRLDFSPLTGFQMIKNLIVINFIFALKNAFEVNENPENAVAIAKYMKITFLFLE